MRRIDHPDYAAKGCTVLMLGGERKVPNVPIPDKPPTEIDEIHQKLDKHFCERMPWDLQMCESGRGAVVNE